LNWWSGERGGFGGFAVLFSYYVGKSVSDKKG
jgi:hypothetical protein